MTDKPNPTYKTRGWLKNILVARTASSPEHLDTQGESEVDAAGSATVPSEPEFSILDQDKAAMDLVMAVENMLNDRQLALYKNNDLEQQLSSANETVIRLKNELSKKEHFILEKEKEFRSLEDKLTSKQMSYDQLLEDYKDYQNSTNSEIENLKYQLEKDRNKYAKLNEEFTGHQYETMKKIKELEESIRDTEIENQQITAQYQKVLEEKNQLLQTITDFTARMNLSLSPSSE